MEIILIRKHFNYLKNRREYDDLFKVVKNNGFEEINPQDILEYKTLSVEEIVELAKLVNEEEEIESLEDLVEKAFWENPEAAAEALSIPIYDEIPWEVYFPDEE